MSLSLVVPYSLVGRVVVNLLLYHLPNSCYLWYGWSYVGFHWIHNHFVTNFWDHIERRCKETTRSVDDDAYLYQLKLQNDRKKGSRHKFTLCSIFMQLNKLPFRASDVGRGRIYFIQGFEQWWSLLMLEKEEITRGGGILFERLLR